MIARYAALIGVTFAGLLIVGGGLVPVAPDSGAALVTYYRDHGDAITLQAWLVMLSTVPGGLLVGLVVARLGGPLGVAFAVAAATTVALIAAGLLLRLGLARHAGALDPATARTLAAVETYWGPLATLPIMVQAAITARAGVFPRWMVAIAGALAIEQLAESATVFGDSGFLTPGGDMNTYVGPVFYVAWIVGLGVACRPGRT